MRGDAQVFLKFDFDSNFSLKQLDIFFNISFLLSLHFCEGSLVVLSTEYRFWFKLKTSVYYAVDLFRYFLFTKSSKFSYGNVSCKIPHFFKYSKLMRVSLDLFPSITGHSNIRRPIKLSDSRNIIVLSNCPTPEILLLSLLSGVQFHLPE